MVVDVEQEFTNKDEVDTIGLDEEKVERFESTQEVYFAQGKSIKEQSHIKILYIHVSKGESNFLLRPCLPRECLVQEYCFPQNCVEFEIVGLMGILDGRGFHCILVSNIHNWFMS